MSSRSEGPTWTAGQPRRDLPATRIGARPWTLVAKPSGPLQKTSVEVYKPLERIWVVPHRHHLRRVVASTLSSSDLFGVNARMHFADSVQRRWMPMEKPEVVGRRAGTPRCRLNVTPVEERHGWRAPTGTSEHGKFLAGQGDDVQQDQFGRVVVVSTEAAGPIVSVHEVVCRLRRVDES